MKTPNFLRTKKLWLGLIVIVLAIAAGLWFRHHQVMAALNRELFDAAKSSDLKGVKEALEKGASVNAKLSDGFTPLMWGALLGDTVLVKLLLEKGAHINAEADNGSTALQWAAVMDRQEVVELLRERGANATLSVAALLGDMKQAEKLIRDGADVNASDQDGWTPLMNAVRKEHADVNAKRWGGSTALMDAVAIPRLDVVELLLRKGADLNAKRDDGVAVLAAARGGSR